MHPTIGSPTLGVICFTFLLSLSLYLPNLSSYYRGIDVVRNKIKMFAHQKVTLPPGRHKIIILDEADRYCRLL